MEIVNKGIDDAASLERLLKTRKSVRVFRPEPVPSEMLDKIFHMARWAPSNCNTQPWTVHLLSGAAAENMRAELLADLAAGKFAPDIPYLMDAYPPALQERQINHIVLQQTTFGIAREDKDARAKLSAGNMGFWGAPHVAFVFMPEFGNEREASDMGCFEQSVMLACTAFGIGSCPQTSLGMMAGTVKRVLGITAPVKLLIGIAIGYEDTSNRASHLEQERLPLTDFLFRYEGEPA